MATNYGISGGAEPAATLEPRRTESAQAKVRIPGWDTSTMIGWVVVGMFGGLFGLLACFLVNRNTARFSRTMIATAVGMGVSILLTSLFLMLFGTAVLSALGGDGYRVDYVGV